MRKSVLSSDVISGRGARAVLAAVVGLAAIPAQGQTPSGAIEEIVVTARKRTETLLAVPITVSAFTSEKLERMALSDLEKLSDFTPGLFFAYQSNLRNDRSAQSSPIIRGMNPRSSFSVGQTAQIFLDGAAIPGGGIRDLGNIERVEVIKGPQSAYFGRATFSGAVNFVTRTPGNEWSTTVNAETGRFNKAKIGLSSEGPLIADQLALRISAEHDAVEGQYLNQANLSGKLGARATDSGSLTLYATPNEDFSAKAFVQYYEDHDGPQANTLLDQRDYNCAAGATGATRNWFCGVVPVVPAARIGANVTVDDAFRQNFLNNAINAGSVFSTPFIDGAGLERRALQATLKLSYDFASGYNVEAISSYQDSDVQVVTDSDLIDTSAVRNPNFGVIPGARAFVNWMSFVSQKDETRSQDIRLTSPQDAPLRWTIGGSYFDQFSVGSFPIDGPFGPDRQLSVTERTARTAGLFGAFYFDLIDQVTLSLEGRYQWDRIKDFNRLSRATFKDTTPSFAPRVILDYRPDSHTTLYASWARGVRPGAFNANLAALPAATQQDIIARTGAAIAIGEEKLDNYEVGMKLRTLDGRAFITLAGYYGEWRNQHVSANVAYTNPATGRPALIAVTSAIGKTIISGVESEATLKASENMDVEASVAVNDTNIRRFVCTQCQTTITGSANVKGNQLAAVPKYSASLGATYRDDLTENFDWFVRADYAYRGSQFATEANLAKTGAANVVNLRTGVESDAVRIETYLSNLLDDRSYKAIGYTPNLANLTFGNALSAALADRRAWGVRARYTF